MSDMPDKSWAASSTLREDTIYPEGHTPRWWRRHPELWAKALTDMPPTLKREKEERDSHSNLEMLFVVLRRLAGPSFIVGGLGVISKDLFWPGVVIVYFGCSILYLEMVFEPWVLRRSLELQCVLITIPLAIAAWFTLAVVVRSGPLEIYSYALRNTNHADGDVVEGIKWNRHFTDLKIAVTNASDYDYRDFDTAIQPDTWNFAATIKNKPSRCELLPIENANQLMVTIVKSTNTFRGRITKVGGEIEINDSAGNSYVAIGRDYGYRLKCALLPARSTTFVLFAAVAPNQDVISKTQSPTPTKPGEWGFGSSEWSGAKSEFDLLGDRPSPRYATLSGTYYVGIRQFPISRTVNVNDGD
jgi:hypothetical protein